MRITREEVLRVAELAHLELTEAEAERYREQLDAILAHVDELKNLDISEVEPMAQVLHEAGGPVNPSLREDVEIKADVADAVLQRAPEALKPYFRVPKVIDR